MFRQLTANERETVQSAIKRSPLLSGVASNAATAARFEEIMAQYARPIDFKAGEIVCRKDDYGSVVYFVIEGSLRQVIGDQDGVMPDLAPPDLFQTEPRRRLWNFWKRRDEDIPIFDTNLRQSLPNMEEVLQRCETIQIGAASTDADTDSADHSLKPVPEEAIVGAVAVLTRSPFLRSVFAEAPTRVLALHWRGMRDIARLFEPARQVVNARCRKEIIDLVRSRAFEIPLFSRLPNPAFAALMDTAAFRFAGGPASEFTAVRQGEPIRSLFVMVSGFGRIHHSAAGRTRSMAFVRRGDVFGLAALAAGGREAQSATTLEFLGDTSMLVFPAAALMAHCLPYLSEQDIVQSDPAAHIEMRAQGPVTPAALRNSSREAPLIDFLVHNDFIRGRQAMVIDQGRCVGCDLCVQACAHTHGGVPRFVRAGPAVGGYAVANACMHCEEAPCLVNCPTEAIFRKFSGEVVVSEALCVGCGACAVACPYDNIRLVEMGEGAEQKERSIPVAAKCDLCIGRDSGPACVLACPHDAVARVDLADHEAIRRLAVGVGLKAVQTA